jgi:hypothetical protein
MTRTEAGMMVLGASSQHLRRLKFLPILCDVAGL